MLLFIPLLKLPTVNAVHSPYLATSTFEKMKSEESYLNEVGAFYLLFRKIHNLWFIISLSGKCTHLRPVSRLWRYIEWSSMYNSERHNQSLRKYTRSFNIAREIDLCRKLSCGTNIRKHLMYQQKSAISYVESTSLQTQLTCTILNKFRLSFVSLLPSNVSRIHTFHTLDMLHINIA